MSFKISTVGKQILQDIDLSNVWTKKGKMRRILEQSYCLIKKMIKWLDVIGMVNGAKQREQQ